MMEILLVLISIFIIMQILHWLGKNMAIDIYNFLVECHVLKNVKKNLNLLCPSSQLIMSSLKSVGTIHAYPKPGIFKPSI